VLSLNVNLQVPLPRGGLSSLGTAVRFPSHQRSVPGISLANFFAGVYKQQSLQFGTCKTINATKEEIRIVPEPDGKIDLHLQRLTTN
jgi:hypothetical protein